MFGTSDHKINFHKSTDLIFWKIKFNYFLILYIKLEMLILVN